VAALVAAELVNRAREPLEPLGDLPLLGDGELLASLLGAVLCVLAAELKLLTPDAYCRKVTAAPSPAAAPTSMAAKTLEQDPGARPWSKVVRASFCSLPCPWSRSAWSAVVRPASSSSVRGGDSRAGRTTMHAHDARPHHDGEQGNSDGAGTRPAEPAAPVHAVVLVYSAAEPTTSPGRAGTVTGERQPPGGRSVCLIMIGSRTGVGNGRSAGACSHRQADAARFALGRRSTMPLRRLLAAALLGAGGVLAAAAPAALAQDTAGSRRCWSPVAPARSLR